MLKRRSRFFYTIVTASAVFILCGIFSFFSFFGDISLTTAASIGAGVLGGMGLLWLVADPLFKFVTDVGTAAWRSCTLAFMLVCLAYDNLMKTMRRVFADWRQEVRRAPAHSWRSCPST